MSTKICRTAITSGEDGPHAMPPAAKTAGLPSYDRTRTGSYARHLHG